MAATYDLNAQPRADKGKGVARKLRAESRVPAVLYGPGLEVPRTLSIDSADLRHAITTDHGDRVLLRLNIEGEKQAVPAIVKEIVRHPVHHEMLHADLYAVDMASPVEVKVPLLPSEGIPFGVKNEGGVLEWMRRDVTIRVLPDKIPARIEVDTASLRLNQAILAEDAVQGEFELAMPGNAPICHVVPTRMSLEVSTEEEGEEGEEGAEGAAEGAAEGEAAEAAEGDEQD